MDQLFQDPAQSVQLLVSGFGDGQALPPPDGLVVMVKLRLLDPEEQAPQLPHDPAQSTEGVGEGAGEGAGDGPLLPGSRLFRALIFKSVLSYWLSLGASDTFKLLPLGKVIDTTFELNVLADLVKATLAIKMPQQKKMAEKYRVFSILRYMFVAVAALRLWYNLAEAASVGLGKHPPKNHRRTTKHQPRRK